MNSSHIQVLHKPTMTDPIFIQSLSQKYQVASTVNSLLLEHTKATKFAYFHSPFFPDYLIAEPNGLNTLPHYELYASTLHKPNLVILKGSVELLPKNAIDNYEIFTTIFNYAKELQCKKFISYSVFTPDQVEDTIYLAATSRNLVSHLVRNIGGKIFTKGKIAGAFGLLLGLAEFHGLKGVCILKPLIDGVPPEVAALSVFNYILKLLK